MQAGESAVLIFLSTTRPGKLEQVGAGSYVVGEQDVPQGTLDVFGWMQRSLPDGTNGVLLQLQSGQVVLDRVDERRFEGSLDVTFENGERLEGTFDTEACPRL